MIRIRLIFDQGYGISNCWYPIKHDTVDGIINDLMGRFGIKDFMLEMDGFKFLTDGLTRLLFKDNDLVYVRQLSRKRSMQDLDGNKRIKYDVNQEIIDSVDSADEYCSETSIEHENELETLIDCSIPKNDYPDETSFHLSVNATNDMYDQDSSDGSSVFSSNIHSKKDDSTKEDKSLIDSTSTLQKDSYNTVQPAIKDKSEENDRLDTYDGNKVEDLSMEGNRIFYSHV